jgi:hypothetical protein
MTDEQILSTRRMIHSIDAVTGPLEEQLAQALKDRDEARHVAKWLLSSEGCECWIAVQNGIFGQCGYCDRVDIVEGWKDDTK